MGWLVVGLVVWMGILFLGIRAFYSVDEPDDEYDDKLNREDTE